MKDMKINKISVIIVSGCLLFCKVSFAQSSAETIQAAVGYENSGGRAIFNVPRKYNPTIGPGFLKLFVSYPDMRPLENNFSSKIKINTVEIIVDGYPVNGTQADAILKNRIPGKYISRNDSEVIYQEYLGNSSPMEAHLFRDEHKNLVMVEILGDWSKRNFITHGISPDYEIRCYYNKKSPYDFKSIDRDVAKFIDAMKVR